MKNKKATSHTSSGSLIEPYMMGFTPGDPKDLSQKERFGNYCDNVFKRIAENIKARMANGGKTTGLIELKEI